MLTSAQKEFYSTNGYVLVEKLLDLEYIEEMFSTLVKLLKLYGGKSLEPYDRFNSWEDNRFNEFLIRLREQDRKRFSAVYEAVSRSLSLHKICISMGINNYVSAILDSPHDSLSTQSFFLRMDPPYDRKNAYDWHQDSTYNEYNRGENSIVSWIPMTDVSAKNGSLKICKMSHKDGIIPFKERKLGSDFSTQRIIEEKYLKKYEIIDIEAEKRDVVFINMDLIHRSGDNSSNKLRFTATARHHKILTDEYFQKMLPTK